ncbi:MAG: glycosyltransferase family 39 protein, partial [Leptospiraceae bacterium]|nr:glycosyltransferase family 39 protein [Leptospiraceae bacterium]
MVARKALFWQCFTVPTALKRFFYFPNQRSLQGPALLGLALVLLFLHALRLYFALDGQLHPDEAYYWAWSQKPALSYYDQGPGIAYYIWLWVTVLGNNYVALKMAALAASFLTIYMFCLAGRDMGLHGWQPLLTGIVLFFIPGILGGNALIMHDSMMILAWSGALWMSVRAIRWRKATDLIGLFFFLGLGGLSKYTMFLFAIALIVWLLLHPAYREFWFRPASWAGLALALAMISPILVWNMENHWDGI